MCILAIQLTAMASCEIVGCRNTPRQWQRDGRTGWYKRCWDHRDAVDDSAEYKLCAVAGCMARVKHETCWAHRETAVFKNCDTCGQSFPAPVWKKTCVPCFSAKKRTPPRGVLEGLAAMMVTPRQPPEEAAPPGPRVVTAIASNCGVTADMDNLMAWGQTAPTWPPPYSS